MWALFDTAMYETVIETSLCSGCGTEKYDTATGSVTKSSTAVSGTLNNPSTAYSGFKGTGTVCIVDTDITLGGLAPTTANIAA